MDRTDAELMRAIAAGETASFRAFYDRHAGRAYALLCRLLPQGSDAEDVLQETFCQVWDRAGQYDPARATPLVWLLLIARSRARDLLRRQCRRPEVADAAEPGVAADPGAGLEQTEARLRVCAALTRLPEEQLRALRLAFFGGLTHGEIAQALELPLGTVKTRIRLALARLRNLLQEPAEVPTP
jgi:RNA polymerase sigma-70 factor (ECF subfamily)